MIKSLLKKSKRKIETKIIKFLIWDFDHTLYINWELGEKLKESFFQYLNQNSESKVSRKKFERLFSDHRSWSSAVAKTLNEPEIKIINDVEKIFNKSSYLEKNLPLVKQIEGLNQYRHLILTNSPAQEVKKCLKKIGFSSQQDYDFFPFEKIIDCNLAGELKPSLAPFKKVLDYTQAHPKRHLLIGDSYHHDIEPAEKVGFQAVLVEDLKNYLNITLKQ